MMFSVFKKIKIFNNSDTKSSVKNNFVQNNIKCTNSDVIVSYKIDKNDQLRLHRLFKPDPDSKFDPKLWEEERTNRNKHQQYYNFFAELIPREYRKGIQYVRIFDRGDSSELARMGPKNWNNLKIFELEMAFNLFDIKFCYFREILDYPRIVFTMLHEFGHYLTMNQDQRYCVRGGPFYKDESIIKQINLLYYAHDESYGLLDPERNQEDIAEGYETNYQRIQELLSKRKGELLQNGVFVRRYSTKSVEEDAADTFAYFVLLDERPEPGISLLGDKVLLFCQYPKMAKIRKAIRDNLKKLGVGPNMPQDELEALRIKLQTPNAN
ncbi:hypothetical protein [Cardinium endosymbiont of Nabis limbatus]|uniref:hypothetical protein n=1 Tax=Cardinium endosymbiont of Nabis limbatus TaxID=3066217 RepID=UPI003AF38FA9